MKNKVDISKLIEKKYKGNTLDLSDILEQIDLVLQENITNYEYRRETDPGYLEEKPESVNISQRMYGAQGIRNEIPDEPGYGDNIDNVPQVRPDKIAEADGEIKKKSEPFTIQVPDIFSLITNAQMEVGKEDRELIKRIVKNIGADQGSWIARINSINRFTEDAQGNPAMWKGGIRTAVSNLIFLNLLKKISFFVAQPGKLFEYILAPLIGTDAVVGGKEDKDIIDVTKFSQGKAWGYSLKLFTGKESEYAVEGSRKNLEVAISNFKGKPITYIIAVANETKRVVEFAELNVTTDIEYFNKGDWSQLKNMTDGALFVAENKIGLLIHKNKNDLVKGGKMVAQPTTAGVSKPKLINITNLKTNFAGVEKKFGQFNQDFRSFKSFLDKREVERLKIDLQKSSQFGSYAEEYKKFLSTEEQKKKGKPPQQIKEIDAYINARTIDFAAKLLSDWNIHYNEQYNLVASQQQQSQEPAETQPQQSQEPAETQPQQKEEKFYIIKSSKDDPQRALVEQFNFRLKSTWDQLNKIPLNLGDPKIYNKQQLLIASSLAEDMSEALKAFQLLNRNLINFFATSKKEAQAGNYGTECIKNANTISDKVSRIEDEEKGQSKNLPSEV